LTAFAIISACYVSRI